MPATRATTEGNVPRRPTRGNGRPARSLPSLQEFPRALKLHRLAPQGALEASVALAQLVELGALGLAGELLRAGSQQLLSPPREQRLRDVALPRELSNRLVALQRGEHEPVFCIHEEILRSLFAALRTGAPDGCAASRAGRNHRGDRI